MMRAEPADWPELVLCLENIGRDLMQPDLADAGVAGPYAILASAVGMDEGSNCYGATNAFLAETYRDYLGERYRGNGPACVINDSTIDADRQGPFPDRIPLAVATMVHELIGHTYQVSGFCKPLPPGEEGARAAAIIRANVARQDDDPSITSDVVEYMNSQHDWRFVRRVLHAAFRLEQRSIYCPLAALLPWPTYSHGSPWAFRSILEDECERLQQFPISFLDEITPPAEFLDVVLQDQQRFAEELQEAAA